MGSNLKEDSMKILVSLCVVISILLSTSIVQAADVSTLICPGPGLGSLVIQFDNKTPLVVEKAICRSIEELFRYTETKTLEELLEFLCAQDKHLSFYVTRAKGSSYRYVVAQNLPQQR